MAEAPGLDVLIVSAESDLRAAKHLARALQGERVNAQPASTDDPGLVSSPDGPLGQARLVMLVIGRAGVHPVMESVAQSAPGRVIVVTLAGVGESLERQAPGRIWIPLSADVLDPIQTATFVKRVQEVLADEAGRPEGSSSFATPPEPPPQPPPIDEAWSQTQTKQSPVQTASPRTRATKSAPPSAGRRASKAALQAAFESLDSSSNAALSHAAVFAGLGGRSRVHSEHLFGGIYVESSDRVAPILASAAIGPLAVAGLVKGYVEGKDLVPVEPGSRIDALPSLTDHAERALLAAHRLANEQRASGINPVHILVGLISLDDCALAGSLRDAGLTAEAILAWRSPQAAAEDAEAEAIADYRSDEARGGPDLLGITREVDAIATVLAAREVEPPLALGLFGDWGTGKTFFMNELEQRIAQLADWERKEQRPKDEKRVYCREIVQLRFNAWHYIDENLWASLASAIFEGLDDAISRRELPPTTVTARAEERALLLHQRAQVTQDIVGKEAERNRADAEAAAAAAEVERVDGLYEELAEAIRPEQILAGAARVTMGQPEVRDAIETRAKAVDDQVTDVANALGIKPETLKAELAGSSDGGYLAAWRALLHDQGRRVWLPMAVVGAVAVAFAVAWELLGFEALVPGTTLVGLLGGAAVGLRPLLEAGGRVSRVLVDARAEGRKLIDEKREELRKEALDRKQAAEATSKTATNAIKKGNDDLAVLDKRLDEIRPGREMANFVRLRQSSSDYRSRLGVVAQARDDFEELTRLLDRDRAESDAEPPADAEEDAALALPDGPPPPPPVERIVLYIDDLDRCKEKEVVAVLQAVHLLLAFRLFVVVVAVDPRWLLHSLQSQSQVLGGEQLGTAGSKDDDRVGWESTPLNYLEKIFQIPFALRPMGSGGFGAVIDNLVGFVPDAGGGGNGETADSGATNGQAEDDTSPTNGKQPEVRSESAEKADAPPESEGAVAAVPSGNGAGPAAAGQEPPAAPAAVVRPIARKPRSLTISADERARMALMHPLIATPRGAKRFVNVYRLLKASTPVSEQASFERPEVNEPVLLLLAMLTGFPAEASTLLRSLVDDERDSPWWDWVFERCELEGTDATRKDQPAEAARWDLLLDKLRKVAKGSRPDLLRSDVRLRARAVARYSFESSRITFDEEPTDGATGQSPSDGRVRETAAS